MSQPGVPRDSTRMGICRRGVPERSADVDVAGEREVRACGADAGVEVFHRCGARVGEGDAVHRKTCRFQHAFDQAERTGFCRRHRGTAQEIAGNRSLILVSALVPRSWEPGRDDTRLLFTQPVITRPDTKRVALVVPVNSLSRLLNSLREPGIELEHVYDY